MSKQPKVSKEMFGKIAQEIKDSTIVRQNPYEDKPVEKPTGSVAYEDFKHALDWFYQRSNLVYRTSLIRAKNGEVNPLTKKPYTKRELTIARNYHVQMQRLASEWNEKYNKYFKEKGYITSKDDFTRAELGENKTDKPDRGVGRPVPNQGSSSGFSTSVGPSDVKKALELPPITDFINLFELIDNYNVNNAAASWIIQNLKIGVIDLKDWRRNYVDDLATGYSKKPLKVNEYFKFIKSMEIAVTKIINDVFNQWQILVHDHLDDSRMIRKHKYQNRMRSRWIEALRAKSAEAHRLLKG
jgi:hypothetical protein